MTAEQIHVRLNERFGDAVLDLHTDVIDPWIGVDPGRIDEVATFCKFDPELGFKSLVCLSGVDDHANILVVYHLHSLTKLHKAVLKVSVGKGAPVTRTVTNVWRGANWFERECFDLFGVRFEGHPDLRRILLPDDWEGHPLRKEYVFPTEYGGVDNTRDYSF
jgi:NADH-quinone oxidoreductase subunit C